MSTSGRAGLFTMDTGRFFGDLRGTPYTSPSRQGSGALRLEFGQLTVTNASITSAIVLTTIQNHIAAVAERNRIPCALATSNELTSGGLWTIAILPCTAASGILTVTNMATGQYSGYNSGMAINYMVIGY